MTLNQDPKFSPAQVDLRPEQKENVECKQ